MAFLVVHRDCFLVCNLSPFPLKEVNVQTYFKSLQNSVNLFMCLSADVKIKSVCDQAHAVHAVSWRDN